MAKLSWSETRIFKFLISKKGTVAEELIVLLKNPRVMASIETILDSAGTTPKDFTLHDSSHSFRVAEQMWDLIPEKTKGILSEYELTFLLLSAYLHDIGMSPSFDRVERHYTYLSSDNKSVLSDDEIYQLQKWIDDNDSIKTIDIRNEKIINNENLSYIMSYYIRYKHNDWSGDWVKNNLNDLFLNNYPGWVDDVIKVCKSHHYGIEVLMNENYNPRPVGKLVNHLRYLSMCLRVADVMENDPGRTPEVILSHRSVSELSEKYWIKDHYFNLFREGNKFTIHARPEKAFIHKAIEETASYIEEELRLCKQLIAERPLDISTFGKLKNYEWDIEAVVNKDIKEKDSMYEYVQGAFRPNTSKLLELLAGNQLYGNAIWSVREMLQNAFDAVKEKIAYQIINEDREPISSLAKLGEFNEVNIRLENRVDGYWLVCKDSGVGMTKNIIVNYFLESGSSKRHEISQLERLCKAKGFNFGRTGQFGIGVLSYFMIAEKIVINTKRVQDTGYNDDSLVGLTFEINGVHGFGELRQLKKSQSGTEIQLKLRSDIIENIGDWDVAFRNFVKNYLSRAPCVVNYESCLSEVKSATGFGWVISAADIKNMIVRGFYDMVTSSDEPTELSSMQEQKEYSDNLELIKKSMAEIREVVDFLYKDGDLPNNLGKYRIHIPYFKLNYGSCFSYLREEIDSNGHCILKINKGYCYKPEFEKTYYSLKGFDISVVPKNALNSGANPFLYFNLRNAYVELDIEDIESSSLTVSRHNMLLDESFVLVKKYIEGELLSILEANVNQFDNIYGSINRLVSGLPCKNEFWPISFRDKLDGLFVSNQMKWQKIAFPTARDHYPLSSSTDKEPKDGLMYGEDNLMILKEILSFNGRIAYDWIYTSVNKFRLGLLLNKKDSAITENSSRCLVVTKEAYKKADGERHLMRLVEMPKKWNRVIGLQIEDHRYDEFLLNSGGVLAKLYDEGLYKVIRQLSFEDAIVKSFDGKKEAFCFLLRCLIDFKSSKWLGLCENRFELISGLFSRLKISTIFILCTVKVRRISVGNWEEFSFVAINNILPDDEDVSYNIYQL